jgi:carboxypeptidase family protein/TonB-dependent receptor-like protein
MMRIRSWSCIGVMVLAGAATPASAQVVALPQLALSPELKAASVAAPIKPSELNGVVKDESGKPLSGAVISALGSTSAFAVSNDDGHFTFRNLPPGPYLVRAHLQNYLPSRGRVVQVTADGRTTSTIELTRKLSDSTEPAVIAAGVGPVGEPAASGAEADDRHQHDELAWRLRHLKRSVLKEAEASIAELDKDESLLGESLTSVSRAVGDSARFASALFSELPVNGQVNLLTSTSFDRPQDLFTLNGPTPRGVAYVAIEAPGATGDWTMRGTMTQGDLASWILAGSYIRHQPSAHVYEAGVSYATQRYLGGNGEALAAMRDGSRNVGVLYAMDNWRINPELQIGYGAKYARYDYLADRGLISPRVTMILQPDSNDSLKVRTTVMHREVAPGAEEFIPPSVGLWLPPERTFSQVRRASFVPERHNQIEIAVDRQWADHVIVGFRAFAEQVEDQVVTVFGASLPDTPAEIGHYQVGSAGDFRGHGWGLTFTRTVGENFRASVDYTQAQTRWGSRSTDADALFVLAPSVKRSDERIHDVTASVESILAPSATRLMVVYKLNTAYAASGIGEMAPTAGVRFDVQVNQALPFMNFTSAQWEMLVAVSNLFKEALYENSVYDELMVIRPPKRVLGGVTVRF